MVDPISIGLGAVQGLSGLAGLLGGDAARRRAEAARQAAINELSGELDTDYGNLVQNDRSGLLAATGLGGDAIQSLGRNLGSSLAGAGVYNSSATAGALQQATAATQSNLAGLAGQNYQNEQGLLNANRRYLTGAKLNLANQQYGEAQGQLSGARNGLSSFLGSLGQFNLARSGGNQVQAGLGRQAGGYGGLAPLDMGAGAIATFNPNAFGGVLGRVHQKTMFGTQGYNSNGY